MGLTYMYKVYDDPNFIEEKVKEVKASFKDPGPYILIYRDLYFQNIIAENSKITAIINWENAAYLPWWKESLSQKIPIRIVDSIWEKVDQRLASEENRRKISQPFYKLIKAFNKKLTYVHEDEFMHSG